MRLISTRVIACCLRRKEGEFRTFRSYTEEEIFFWVWFNRQEAAQTHCSVMLFLWVQDSQVSLWVFFFDSLLKYVADIFGIISLVCLKQESPERCTVMKTMSGCMWDREQPVMSQQQNIPLTYLNKNSPKKKWSLVSGDISELLSQGTLL